MKEIGCELPERCPTCGKRVPRDDMPKHLAGIDVARIECPRQDIAEIKLAEAEGRLAVPSESQ